MGMFSFHKVLAAICVLCVLSGCSGGTSAPAGNASSQTSEETAQQSDNRSSVTIYAGSLMPGYTDGENPKAQFIKPYGLCKGPDGGLLIVDSYANLLRISDGNTVAAFAGSVESLDRSGYPFGGYLEGASGKAMLSRPRFAAVSEENAVVFSDTGNNRIRLVYNGQVYLLAGTGTAGFRDGDYKTAEFNTPSGIAIDANGTVYVADTLNHCIRAISPTGEVSTLAGSPQKEGFRDGNLQEALFCEPNDIEIGADGALYVVDKGNQRIRKILGDSVTTVAGSGIGKDSSTGYIVGGYQDGTADEALFQYPTGLSIADGAIYVADTGNNCIRLIENGMVSTIAGTRMPGSVNGTVQEARFNQPLDVLFEDGALFISDSYNHVIRVAEWDGGSAASSSADNSSGQEGQS